MFSCCVARPEKKIFFQLKKTRVPLQHVLLFRRTSKLTKTTKIGGGPTHGIFVVKLKFDFFSSVRVSSTFFRSLFRFSQFSVWKLKFPRVESDRVKTDRKLTFNRFWTVALKPWMCVCEVNQYWLYRVLLSFD